MTNHDTRFALIDTAGDERFAARINGTFQIGKERDATPPTSRHSRTLSSSMERMVASSVPMVASLRC